MQFLHLQSLHTTVTADEETGSEDGGGGGKEGDGLRLTGGWTVEEKRAAAAGASSGDNGADSGSEDDQKPGEGEESEFKPGTFVWARLQGYPWWPGVVMPDPRSSLCYDDRRGARHILFFERSSKLQRAWVNKKMVSEKYNLWGNWHFSSISIFFRLSPWTRSRCASGRLAAPTRLPGCPPRSPSTGATWRHRWLGWGGQTTCRGGRGGSSSLLTSGETEEEEEGKQEEIFWPFGA